MLRRLLSALTFWGVLLAWAIWITREPKHAQAFGFLGGWLLTVIAAALQDHGRRRFQPPIEQRSMWSIGALQLIAGGITVAGWWAVWFCEPISHLLFGLGFYTLLAAPLVIAWLSGFVHGIPNFERHRDAQPD